LIEFKKRIFYIKECILFSYTNDYLNKANQYAKDEINGSLILAYNEFAHLFKKYLHEGNRTLDFGCGAGRSTRYLANAGLAVHDVDMILAC
jgi:2-polyprenyl-3-methyl-5-hydroxy-6-metoxy-1,4-benzoquinol methylase